MVMRGIFGLANSPRLWWRHFRDSLIKLGAVQGTLDRAPSYFFEVVDGIFTLVCILGVHVDDVIGAAMLGAGHDKMDAIRKLFEFGDWHVEKLDYCGKQVWKLPDGSIKLNQANFCKNIQVTPVPKYRSMTLDAELTAAEMSDLRSAVGSCQWLVGQTRPDLAAATSLGQGPKPTVATLTAINGVLREATKTIDFSLHFKPIDFRRACLLEYSDASWANAPGNLSQAGYLVYLADNDVFTMEGGPVSLMEWKSHRIRRVCRSTLAAETMAMDAGSDAAMQLRHMFAEALFPDFTAATGGRLPQEFLPLKCVTDCRSLYDLLTKGSIPSVTQERRLAIDIAALTGVSEEFNAEVRS